MQSNSIRNAKAFSLSPYICINLEAGQSSKVISFVWCTIVDDAIVCTDLPPLPPDPGTKWKTCKSSSPPPPWCVFWEKGWESRKGWTGDKSWGTKIGLATKPHRLLQPRGHLWMKEITLDGDLPFYILWSLDDVIVRRKLRILCVNISFRKFDNFWELSQSTKLEMTYHLKLRRRQTCLHQTILCIGILYILYI